MKNNTTVFVVDDDPGALQSAQWLLESDGLNVETYSTVAAFLDAYDPDRPSCLVLDVQMPSTGGLKLQKRLIASGTCPPIIFVTGSGDVPTSVCAMKRGAFDFLEKPVNGEELVSLVRKAIEQDVRRCHLDRQQRETQSRLDRLTPREREVMSGLLQGKPAKGIAAELGIAHKTTLRHRARVRQKLGVRSDPELVRRFVEHSLELQDPVVTHVPLPLEQIGADKMATLWHSWSSGPACFAGRDWGPDSAQCRHGQASDLEKQARLQSDFG